MLKELRNQILLVIKLSEKYYSYGLHALNVVDIWICSKEPNNDIVQTPFGLLVPKQGRVNMLASFDIIPNLLSIFLCHSVFRDSAYSIKELICILHMRIQIG